ncbi:hypothetical protein TZ53_10975 [Sphingobium sp. YBL2]|nr:hypothetical protein TZ53_10975 [Sphingobium sp. YBL2]
MIWPDRTDILAMLIKYSTRAMAKGIIEKPIRARRNLVVHGCNTAGVAIINQVYCASTNDSLAMGQARGKNLTCA